MPFERAACYTTNDFIDAKTNGYHHFDPPPPNKGFFYINGNDTNLKDFQTNMVHLSKAFGNYNVEGIHSPTRGFFTDVHHAYLAINYYHADESVRLLKAKMYDFFKRSDENAIAFVCTNSRGAAYTRNCLYDMGEQYSKRVFLLGIAPAAYTPREICHDVMYIESRRDFVTYLDVSGRKRCNHTIITLNPHPEAAWHDHSLISKTFIDRITQTAENYLQK